MCVANIAHFSQWVKCTQKKRRASVCAVHSMARRVYRGNHCALLQAHKCDLEETRYAILGKLKVGAGLGGKTAVEAHSLLEVAQGHLLVVGAGT